MVGIAIAGGVTAAASLGSGILQSNAAEDASKAQQASDAAALQQQQSQFNQTQQTLAPYVQAGTNNLPAYGNFYQGTQNALTAAGNRVNAATPGTMTQAQLEQTPGYAFQLQQGAKGNAANAAAAGLGVSGAALKGLDAYNTGLASSNYQNQFNNQQTLFNDAQTQFGNVLNGSNTVYNQLGGPVSLGENAAAQTGNIGQQSANAQSGLLQNSGVAGAAGITGGASGLASGLNGIGNSATNAVGAINNQNNQAALLGALGGSGFAGDPNAPNPDTTF